MVKKRLFTMGIFSLILTFVLGYYIGVNKEKKVVNSLQKKYEELSLQVSGSKINNKEYLDKLVEKDSEILFKVKINNNQKDMLEMTKIVKDENIVGKKVSELEKIYEEYGYKVENVDSQKIQLVRNPLKYEPNRYVLAVENNEIIIAKSDDKGNIFNDSGSIKNKEGTGTKINSLKIRDIQSIVKGDVSMQFESIEKLNDGIKDFDIRYEMPE